MVSQKMVYIIIAEDFFLKKSKASYIGSHIFSNMNVELGIDMLNFYGFSGTFKGFFGTPNWFSRTRKPIQSTS